MKTSFILPMMFAILTASAKSTPLRTTEWSGMEFRLDGTLCLPQADVMRKRTVKKLAVKDVYLMFKGHHNFSFNIGMNIVDKKKNIRRNPKFKTGVSYFSVAGATHTLPETERKPYDTLISTQTGEAIHIDSVTTRTSFMTYKSEQLRLDASIIYRTNPQERWSFFAGAGIAVGWAFSTFASIYYSVNKHTQNADNNSTYSAFSSTDINFRSEIFSSRKGFGASAGIPMGIDWRVGRKNEFWKQVHVYYEFRPGVNITSIPEVATIIKAGMQHGFGFRFSWE